MGVKVDIKGNPAISTFYDRKLGMCTGGNWRKDRTLSPFPFSPLICLRILWKPAQSPLLHLPKVIPSFPDVPSISYFSCFCSLLYSSSFNHIPDSQPVHELLQGRHRHLLILGTLLYSTVLKTHYLPNKIWWLNNEFPWQGFWNMVTSQLI